MEHIIQFGVSIDENKIVDAATRMAAKKILEIVEEEVNRFARGYGSGLSLLFRNEVMKIIEGKKDYVIEQSINELSKNLSRTKAVREHLNKCLEQIEEG